MRPARPASVRITGRSGGRGLSGVSGMIASGGCGSPSSDAHSYPPLEPATVPRRRIAGVEAGGGGGVGAQAGGVGRHQWDGLVAHAGTGQQPVGAEEEDRWSTGPDVAGGGGIPVAQGSPTGGHHLGGPLVPADDGAAVPVLDGAEG